MSWVSIANILGIGLSTLSRRRSVFGRLDNYDAIKNSQQDDIIRDINAHTSDVGQRLAQGQSRNVPDVAVFSAEKRNLFLRAQNCRSPVKLSDVEVQPSRSGEGVNVLCGRGTGVTVIPNLTFPYKQPPSKCKRTVGDIRKMSARQYVGELTGQIVHLRASTEMVEIQGRQVETQSVMLQDASGTIRVQLWETQVGVVSSGKTYKFTQLSTREFQGELVLTMTRETTVEAVSSLPGPGAMPRCDVKEDPVVSVSGEVIRVEVTVSRTCRNCKTAQVDFQPKAKFHRCCKCKMLQKTGMYKPSAIANVTVLGDIGEMNVSANNSVLHRYLVNCGLSHLLQDAQDIEEHFLHCGVLKLHIQNDNVVAIANISEESPCTSEESTSEVSMPAAGEVGSVSATVELQANVESPAMSATTESEFVCETGEAELVCAASEAKEMSAAGACQ
ncbi:ATP-dependent DNA helicase PIF1 [Labeo rohita]|uniref:ATP-dependent DNA helicase PIF1 n=1 Tax=Labeo rohita TaxID=84645 RepID=A0A498MAM8_LABRO|nr:ATP-dependent DNA helicase PIF1 [Labeo rohita]